MEGVKSGLKYPESVRQFALSLHYHSPRGYEYVRDVFDKNLPSSSTIKNWYSNSDTNSEPGICKKSMSILKKQADRLAAKGEKLICALKFDEMSIRKHVQWIERNGFGKYSGYISYGSLDCPILPVANQAIVFLINGINEHIQLPVAYHFITTLDYKQRSELLKDIVEALTDCGIEIASVTFDGWKSNFTMCKNLGAKFEFLSSNVATYFENPTTKDKIRFIYDNSHMLKLVRNNLAKKGVLFDQNGDRIEWQYFIRLEEYAREKGFRFTHKLTKKHILYYKNSMNVRLAVETLSESVATSMEYLMQEGQML